MKLQRRFTLVELLVVITVVIALVAISIPALSGIRSRSQRKATEAFMQRLKLAIESYSNDFGDYPPSSFRKLGIKKGNDDNEGGEVLVRCLTTSDRSGPYFDFKETEVGNTDQDSLRNSETSAAQSTLRTTELLEPLDVWGNAILYMHNRDYDKGGAINVNGKAATVAAHQNEKTKQFSGLTSFQLYSAGPDGEVGTDDDVWVAGE